MSVRPRRSAIRWKAKCCRKCPRRFFSGMRDARCMSTSRLRRCLRSRPLSSLDFQLDVSESHFRRAAGVELQGENATAAARLVGEVDALVAVEPGSNVVADRFDL